MNDYSNYSNEQLKAYIENTRRNAAGFDKEGSYSTATVHYAEATRAQYALLSRNAK